MNGLDTLVGALSEICGKENVISDADGMESFSQDMAEFSAQPAVVVRPGTEQEVIKILETANRLKVPIVPRGAGSSLTGASVLRDGIVVDMRRFTKILKVDTVNWYVHVQPGISLEELNQELTKHGFFFPPDPASSYICTVGGAIAEGSGGLRCVKYGTMKDWVIALRVVLPNGKTANLGEPLAKNRAGFDLVHLMVGSEGTLGVITEAYLKIIPLSTARASRFMLTFEDWQCTSKLIRQLRSSGIMPHIFEFLDRDNIEALNAKLHMDLEEVEATLIVDIGEESVQTAEEIFGRCGARQVKRARDDEESEMFYQIRAMAYLAIKDLGMSVYVEDVVVPIDRLEEFLAKTKEIAAKYRLKIPVNGHAGDGNVHPLILYDASNEESKKAAHAAFEELCRFAIAAGGSVTGEHGVGAQKGKYLREQLMAHDGEESLRLMKEIKHIFDPNGIMNPGKYVDAA